MASRIPYGPSEVNVDLFVVQDAFKSSDEFTAIKEEYTLHQLPAIFGAHIEKFPRGDEQHRAGVDLLDKDPQVKHWNNSLTGNHYVMGCQHILRPFVARLQHQLGRQVQASDLS
ncbi:unnamed protein product [Cuscuta europaea]|uniref:Uncharacterized protein n=1 Tax=Cuscuta europaea TaxID=41803 RepID=A0A9P0ZFR9_CUSEU|nr:unnamed protein product [Cuscuta europaea]